MKRVERRRGERHWTDFVSADPWFRPEAACAGEGLALLQSELASRSDRPSSGGIEVVNAEVVSAFFSPEGEHPSRCPRCGAELSERELSDWLSEDYGKDGGFRLAPRAMPCCGAQVALNALIYEPPFFAFARFGFRIMNPNWRFMETLDSERAVDEIGPQSRLDSRR